MRTREDIESYLMRSGLGHDNIGDKDMWLVREPATTEKIIVRLAGPVVIFRAKVMELGRVARREELFEALLRINASDMLQGSYGIAEDAVVLIAALRLENLDYNEFQGVIDDFSLAFTNHYEQLAAFRDAA
ncbi:MAG: YbjN domain-containing protein [Deltaproteobacteria bacterium]|nr:YbjN domain-containing protein [Deltaproteobacteria bacterium]